MIVLKPQKQELDNNIIPILKKLNKNGYITA